MKFIDFDELHGTIVIVTMNNEFSFSMSSVFFELHNTMHIVMVNCEFIFGKFIEP